MNKITLIMEVAVNLRNLANSIEAYAKESQVTIDSSRNEQALVEEPKPRLITIEKVRAVLAEKSQSGKQPEVKALITKYGAKKLTDIDPACYAELLKEAEAI